MTWDQWSVTEDMAMAAVWAEPDWDAGAMECVRPILSTFSKLPEHASVLDIGCGVGRLMEPIKRLRPSWEVVGLDTSAVMLRWARFRLGPAEIVHGGVERLPRLGRFDGVYSVLTLQHLEPVEQVRYLDALPRVLWDDGVVCLQITTGNEDDRGPLSHPLDPDEVVERLTSKGMTAYFREHPGRPSWRWIVGRL